MIPISTVSKQDWQTPPKVFHYLETIFGEFDMDIAASAENALSKDYYTEDNSALKLKNNWHGNCFCNPPFNMLNDFVAKAIYEFEEVKKCNNIVILCPARNDNAWSIMAHQSCSMSYSLYPRINYINGDGDSSPFQSQIFCWTRKEIGKIPVASMISGTLFWDRKSQEKIQNKINALIKKYRGY